MTVDYKVLEYTINALVENLMSKYGTNYESSLSVVLASDIYKKLTQDRVFLENGDIYLFSLLETELQTKGVI